MGPPSPPTAVTNRHQTRARHAHFLKGSIAAFDAPFFSITPAEANGMDPQQRGMLESVYKALENGQSAVPRSMIGLDTKQRIHSWRAYLESSGNSDWRLRRVLCL